MSAYSNQKTKPVSTRMMVFAAIVGLHILVVLGFTNSLALKALSISETVTNIFEINEPRVTNTVPINPQVELQQPTQLEVPVPEVPAIPVTDTQAPISAESTSSESSSNALSYSATRSPDAYYPPMSRQLGEFGVSVIRVCVNPDGSRDGAPTVQTGSGFPRLDEAAIKWATEALRFKPAVNAGASVRACQGFKVKFQLVGPSK